jgi:hypothetical protein
LKRSWTRTDSNPREAIASIPDVALPNKANLFGLQCLDRNKSNFVEVGLKIGKPLISREKVIFAVLNFGIEVADDIP